MAGLTGINTLKRKDDANTVKTSGDYLLAPTASNIPVTQWGIMKVSGNGSDVSQTFNTIGTTEVYVRSTYSEGGWTKWQRLDNFGYNSLAELATGVAGQGPIKTALYNENIPSGGRLDVPSSKFNVGLFVCDLANGSYCVGLVLNNNAIVYLTPDEKITQGVGFVRNGSTGVFSVINDSGTDLVGIKLRLFSNNIF